MVLNSDSAELFSPSIILRLFVGNIQTLPPPPACASYQATCANGECIDRAAICDGDIDCSDGSDESSCRKWNNVEQSKMFKFFCNSRRQQFM